MAVKRRPCLLTLKKGSRLWKPSACRNFPASHTWSTRPVTGWGARSTSLWVHRNLFWKLAWFGHATCHNSLSKTTSFMAPWGVDDALVGRGDAGWITSEAGHPCPCQNCSQRPRAEDWKRTSAESSLMSPRQPKQ